MTGGPGAGVFATSLQSPHLRLEEGEGGEEHSGPGSLVSSPGHPLPGPPPPRPATPPPPGDEELLIDFGTPAGGGYRQLLELMEEGGGEEEDRGASLE